jgi:hypothetical protein
MQPRVYYIHLERSLDPGSCSMIAPPLASSRNFRHHVTNTTSPSRKHGIFDHAKPEKANA